MIKKLFFILVIYSLALPSDFTIARVKYGGGGDWYSDPTSINNLLSFIKTNANIDCSEYEAVTEITRDKIFFYPYLYLTGHGKVEFTPEEVKILREHLLSGGFLHIDDNYGLDEYIRAEIKKIFPDKELTKVPFDHSIYNIKYKFPEGLPKIHEHDKKPPEGLGIFNDGKLVLFYSYQSDLGDGWEDYEVHKNPEHKRKQALKMGCNLVLYFLLER